MMTRAALMSHMRMLILCGLVTACAGFCAGQAARHFVDMNAGNAGDWAQQAIGAISSSAVPPSLTLSGTSQAGNDAQAQTGATEGQANATSSTGSAVVATTLPRVRKTAPRHTTSTPTRAQSASRTNTPSSALAAQTPTSQTMTNTPKQETQTTTSKAPPALTDDPDDANLPRVSGKASSRTATSTPDIVITVTTTPPTTLIIAEQPEPTLPTSTQAMSAQVDSLVASITADATDATNGSLAQCPSSASNPASTSTPAAASTWSECLLATSVETSGSATPTVQVITVPTTTILLPKTDTTQASQSTHTQGAHSGSTPPSAHSVKGN